MNRRFYRSFSMAFLLSALLDTGEVRSAASDSSSSSSSLVFAASGDPQDQIPNYKQKVIHQKISALILAACVMEFDFKSHFRIFVKDEKDSEDLKRFFSYFDPLREKCEPFLGQVDSTDLLNSVFKPCSSKSDFSQLNVFDRINSLISFFLKSQENIRRAYALAYALYKSEKITDSLFSEDDIRTFKNIFDQSEALKVDLRQKGYNEDDIIKLMDSLLLLFGPFFGFDVTISTVEETLVVEDAKSSEAMKIVSPRPSRWLRVPSSSSIHARPLTPFEGEELPQMQQTPSPSYDVQIPSSAIDPSLEVPSPSPTSKLQDEKNDELSYEECRQIWDKWELLQAKKESKSMNGQPGICTIS